MIVPETRPADLGASEPAPVRDRETFALAPRPESGEASRFPLLALGSDGGRLVASATPDARTTDGYLRITAKILLESERQRFRTIGVLSACEGEGRTAAAVNLAVCLGRAKGRSGRVLLVDGDARVRSLSRMFSGPDPAAPPGEEPVRRHPMLVATALEGVDLLTAPIADDVLSIAAPQAWLQTFSELSALYPHIVVDCPAVSENPEALVIRECVEQIVLVVRAGRTPRRLVEKALDGRTDRVLGVILNGPGDRESMDREDR